MQEIVSTKSWKVSSAGLKATIERTAIQISKIVTKIEIYFMAVIQMQSLLFLDYTIEALSLPISRFFAGSPGLMVGRAIQLISYLNRIFEQWFIVRLG